MDSVYTGYIHSFESLAAVDGEGLRCAVFFSGCPLRCVYCHNPDTWTPNVGMEYTPETLLKKILRFKPYFGENGGVTFSGGEPLFQAAFLRQMIPLLRENGISYVVDTSGGANLTEDVKAVLLGASSILLDLKFWDEEHYQKYCSYSMANTMKTLRFLEQSQKNVWIRTVVIPGINDTEEVLDRYLACVREFTCIKEYELLPFHTMGFFKYDNLNLKNPLQGIPGMDVKALEKLQEICDQKLALR